MPEDNVELVRRLFWAFDNDGELWRSMLSPDLVWFPFENNHTPSHGIDAAVRTRMEWQDAWDESKSEPERLVGDGEDVVAAVHLTGQGRTSGANVDVHINFHVKVRDGAVVYVYEYEDWAAALEAAGLSAE